MQDREMKSRFDLKAVGRVLFRILRVIIPLILLYFLFRNLDWAQILSIMAGYPYGFLLLAFGINLFANFIFALRWYYLIRSVGIIFPFWNAVRLVYYGLFISNFLPTTIGGDLIKVVGILREKSEQSRSLRISTVVADRVFSMSSKILLLPFVLWLFPQGFKPVLDLPFLQSPFLLALIPKGISDRVIRYWAAVKPWFRFRNIAVVYLLSYSSLFFTILSYWVVIQAFQPDVPLVNVFFITLLTYFVTILPVSINGIGIQEGSYSLLLMQIGFTYEQAFASALFIRLLTLLVSAFGGILLAGNDRQLWNEVRSEKDEELKQV
jgi:uncharacterized membrane protein YbhN (UPF0104 family)